MAGSQPGAAQPPLPRRRLGAPLYGVYRRQRHRGRPRVRLRHPRAVCRAGRHHDPGAHPPGMAGRRPLCDWFAGHHRGVNRRLYRLAEHRHFHPDVHQRRRRVCPAGVYGRAVAGAYCPGDPQLHRPVDCGRHRLHLLWPGAGDLHHPHRQAQRDYWPHFLDSADRHPAVCRRPRRYPDDGPFRLRHRADGRLVRLNQHQLAVRVYRHLAGAGAGVHSDGVYDPRRRD